MQKIESGKAGLHWRSLNLECSSAWRAADLRGRGAGVGRNPRGELGIVSKLQTASQSAVCIRKETAFIKADSKSASMRGAECG